MRTLDTLKNELVLDPHQIFDLFIEFGDAMSIVMASDGHILSCNEAASKFFDIPEHNIDGRYIYLSEVLVKYGISDPLEQLVSILSANSMNFAVHKQDIYYENICGKLKWMAMQAPANGSVPEVNYRLLAIFSPSLLSSDLIYLHNIINSIPHHLYWKNKNSIYLGCNLNFARAAGLSSPADIVGKSDHDLPWLSEQANTYIEEDKILLREGRTSLKTDVTQRTYQGETILLSVTKVPLKDEQGNCVGLIGVNTDLTAMKQQAAELQVAKSKAEAANCAKDEFLASMSHELRTPLNAILGMSELLYEKEQNSTDVELLDGIRQSGKHLLALINDILDFAKLGENKLQLVNREFELRSIYEEMRLNYESVLRKQGFSFECSYDSHLPKFVAGDARRIKQILHNVIGNAIKFTDQGFIKFGMICVEKHSTRLCLQLRVKDSGCGIPAEKMNMIYERFSQLDSKYGRRYEGAGLGLAITQQLVAMMGGDITVDSELGVGSEFIINIELAVVERLSNEKCGDSLDLLEQVKSEYELEILLVEDNVLNQKVAAMMLNSLNCNVTIADTGMKGVAILEQRVDEFDLIFTDLGLPDFDGIEVTKKMKKIMQANGIDIPIIAMTAHVFDDDKNKCIVAGMREVITKPLMKEHLIKLLASYHHCKPTK